MVSKPFEKPMTLRRVVDKEKRNQTFSKRKSGIERKAKSFERSTGSEVLILMKTQSGNVFAFGSRRMQPLQSSLEVHLKSERCKPEFSSFTGCCLQEDVQLTQEYVEHLGGSVQDSTPASSLPQNTQNVSGSNAPSQSNVQSAPSVNEKNTFQKTVQDKRKQTKTVQDNRRTDPALDRHTISQRQRLATLPRPSPIFQSSAFPPMNTLSLQQSASMVTHGKSERYQSMYGYAPPSFHPRGDSVNTVMNLPYAQTDRTRDAWLQQQEYFTRYGLGQDKIDQRYATTQEMDPRYAQQLEMNSRYVQQQEIDPRYAQQQEIDPRYAQQQEIDPRYAQQQEIDPRYAQQQKLDAQYVQPQEMEQRYVQPQEMDPRYAQNDVVIPLLPPPSKYLPPIQARRSALRRKSSLPSVKEIQSNRSEN